MRAAKMGNRQKLFYTLAFATAASLACQSGASAQSTPFVSAHRGGAAYAPENTMVAFANAVRLGVDDLEADMLLTSDGVAVLMHDTTLDRTTDCTGSVANVTYAELLDCDAAYWFTPGQSTTSHDAQSSHPLRGQGVTIPTVQELLDFAATLSGPAAPTLPIELKDGSHTAAATLVALIQASPIQNRIVVQSFNPTALNYVQSLDASISTLLLTSFSAGLALTYARWRGYDYVAPNHTLFDLNASFVSNAQQAGKQVVPWTADQQAAQQDLIDLGVDGVITNYPGCLLQLEGRLNTSQLGPAGVDSTQLTLCAD